MDLFTAQIKNWHDWGHIFQSIPDFSPLIEHILKKESLPPAAIENLTPGTNAVFKVGDYVIKIYAPPESGIYTDVFLESETEPTLYQPTDQRTELFASRFAAEKNISAPRLVAEGFIKDKYLFAYIITQYINGIEFSKLASTMTDSEKVIIGQKLRAVTDVMNTPCKPFNGIDVINDIRRYKRWDNYPESFKSERLRYVKAHNFGPKVFVHGDLCGDNVLISPGVCSGSSFADLPILKSNLYIIDFADAVLAPVAYEHALVAVELFTLDPAFLRGYFGNYQADKLSDLCFNGLLIHDFGGDIVKLHIGDPIDFDSLQKLRSRIKELIVDNQAPLI